MKSPILFVVFNRPETTQEVFAEIRAARPSVLYVAADGPRASKLGEAELCWRVREIATRVDWPCELKTRFCDANHGCRGVASAIDWFFECEEEGIIVEDDVVPVAGFFEFCDEMLERYRSDPRVGVILGSNFIAPHYRPPGSYFFSGYTHVWGWATWRRAWKLYDGAMTAWPEWREQGALAQTFVGNKKEEAYWDDIFQSVFEGRIDTWAYQLMFMCWENGLLTVNPGHNLIKNIGFGVDATHTTGQAPEFVRRSPPRPMNFPLAHPCTVARDLEADRQIWLRVFNRSLQVKIKRRIALCLSSIPGRNRLSGFKR